MTDTSSTKTRKAGSAVPQRLIIGVVCALCLCLLGSGLFTFNTLSRLRTLYLSNRGHSIAEAIETQARGPGKRNNPAFWQSLLDASYATYSNSIAFLALIDQNGNILASAGKSPSGPLAAAARNDDVYDFEELLGRPRNPRGEANPIVSGWRIRIGLYSSDADFVRRLAFLQLAVSGLAIAALIVLSAYLARMLNRFVEMRAREGAEAQLKSLGMMAASLAHEIRNPLGAMKGLTQLAQEDLPPDDAAQGSLRTVVREAERLERLVTDLLEFARPKEPQISEFDLTGLVSDVHTMLQAKLEASGVALQSFMDPGPLNIQSDAGMLRQVLLNVIINAVDASPAGSAVVVRVVRSEGGRPLTIQVDDAGQGLGGRDPEDLFQPFVTTKTRGTGLGLAISRQIIESLGGALTLEDHAQGGARCSIRLQIR
jgi:signal transduction histidine kinase